MMTVYSFQIIRSFIQILEFLLTRHRNNLTLLIKKINKKDNKIKIVIEEVIKGYEEYLKKIKKYMKENKYNIESKPLISKMGAYLGINMEIMKDNSDSRIADMLIQGMTMGVLSVSKKLDNYKDRIDKELIKLGEEFKEYQQKSIDKLKVYL